MPRVSLERPVNGAEDGGDEEVAVCTVDSGTDIEVAVEPKVGVDVAEDDPD